MATYETIKTRYTLRHNKMQGKRERRCVFTDRDVHRMLRINGIKNPEGEWFRCTDAKKVFENVPAGAGYGT